MKCHMCASPVEPPQAVSFHLRCLPGFLDSASAETTECGGGWEQLNLLHHQVNDRLASLSSYVFFHKSECSGRLPQLLESLKSIQVQVNSLEDSLFFAQEIESTSNKDEGEGKT